MVDRAIHLWVQSRPGPFAARTSAQVWDAALKNFHDCGFNSDGLLDFMMRVSDAGFDAHPTIFGGYIMDRKR